MNIPSMHRLIHNKYYFVLLSSTISTLITEFILFHKYVFYSVGDNVFPLSMSYFYNYQPFFTNVNGGSIGNNIILIIYGLFYFPFFNKYGEIVSFLVTTFIGNSALSLLIYKNSLRYNIYISIFSFIVTIGTEIFLNSGLDLYYELLLLPSTFIPIHAVFPWIIYFIDSIIMDNDNLIVKFLEILAASLLLIIFIGSVLTLVLTTYVTVVIFFIGLLLSSNLKIKRKLFILILSTLVIIVLNVLSFLPSYLSAIPYFSSHVGGNYYVAALKFYLQSFNSYVFNVLTLTYFPSSIAFPYYYIYISTLFAVLLVLPAISPNRNIPKIYYISLILFLLLSAWLAAPYLFPSYISLYSHIPYLWSLDIPWLSFTYVLFVSASISLGNGLVSIKSKRTKIISVIILLILIFTQIYPYYSGQLSSRKAWNPPNYLWKVSNIINDGSYKNPRILVFPTSGGYVAYNFSPNNTYIGAGFWSTLFNGDVYASYFPYNCYSLEWFITIYPSFNLSSYQPFLNAARLLGINYIVITKNFIPKYYFANHINKVEIEKLISTLPSSSIIYDNSQILVYNFSSETVAVIPNYIIFVNVSKPLWYNVTEFHILLSALNLSFVNYSSAALVSSSYEKEITESLKNYTILYRSSDITVIKLNNVPRLEVENENPSVIIIKIVKGNYNPLIPVLVRENYQSGINEYINNYDKIVPGYSNESFIIMTNSSTIIINYNGKNILQYIYLIYFYLLIIIAFVLILIKNNVFKYRFISRFFDADSLQRRSR
ncbi:hypothetical protein [Saccharolobus islandicus]|uniref:Uncharacterized protein n=1 Tax=Saccharolobus islandicus (strain REY15A) TaxID=930945 RepID=F0NE07_SACI5|nr:hypothetical protein [Sulfolobus islandicus]ADX84943.1 hypothetical protein SiRe_0869 [Sulfolobus islandicus REY15A]